jgi:type VI secretion system protein ImpG
MSQGRLLWTYYERELRAIRRLAREFAQQYPREAGRLGLEADRSTDPHVERMIEAFAYLTARVNIKIDDEFPELTDAMLGVLYPHYLAPVPSMTIVQFDVAPGQADSPTGVPVPRHSPLATQPVDGLPCRYRTGYDVTLWPLKIGDAKLLSPPFPRTAIAPPGAKAMLRLRIDSSGAQPPAALELDTLRLHLSGDPSLATTLYELIFNHVTRVVFRDASGAPIAPATIIDEPNRVLTPVGLEIDDALLPYPSTAFPGYRLLSEFFAYPTRFLFADLGGWRRAKSEGALNGRQVEVQLFLNRSVAPEWEQAVTGQTFRLACTPAINLFEKTCEPIPLTQKKYDYQIVPDVHHQYGVEIYSIDEVTHEDPQMGQVTVYEPFYSYRHGDRDRGRAYWYGRRRPSLRPDDRGSEVDLHLVDLDFDPLLPNVPTLVVRATCLNRDLPTQLQRAGDDLRLEPQFAVPATPRVLRAPTATLRPPLRRHAHWRLISHLLLNHLSLVDGDEGKRALQEYLALYDFSDPQSEPQLAAVTQQVRDGVLTVKGRRVVEFVGGDAGGGYARGVEVAIELDEEKYVGIGAYLFASVLERFFALYSSVNSFTKLVYRTKQSGVDVKRWPPRAGEQPVV